MKQSNSYEAFLASKTTEIIDAAGVVGPLGTSTKEPLANWWSKVERGKPGECWPWSASRDKDGYGKFQVGLGGNRQIHVRAHRFGFMALVGSIPEGQVVCHSCDNPPCCNPAHWFVGTPLQNNEDKVAKNRHAKLWGQPLINSRKTECAQGHPLSGDNLYVSDSGFRSCKECGRRASLASYHRRGRAPSPAVQCVSCGQAKPHRAHGRCAACDQAWRRKGGGGLAL